MPAKNGGRKSNGKANGKPSGVFGHIRSAKKRAFLAALVETGGNRRAACIAAKVDKSTPYTRQWKEDRAFQDALELALEMGVDYLEAEALRRAVQGVEEPVGWHKGKAGGTVTRYSDTLLIFLLKGAKPQKYADRHKVSGDEGPPIQFDDVGDIRERLAGRIAGIGSRIGATGFFEKPTGDGGSTS